MWRLLFFVLTTGRCNLLCKYCGGSFPERLVPTRPTYDLLLLKELIESDSNPAVAFYGGEPLLQPKVVKEVMDRIDAKFLIQTNGTLFEGLEWEYWKRMDSILLSIDGTKETTDGYRGEGTYSKVVWAAEQLRKKGYSGDLIARMAVSEKTDIYRDVCHLAGLGLFDHIHWQLDVGWSDSWTDFEGWCARSYEPGILRLIDLWIRRLKRGEVMGLVPILGILKRLREPCTNPPCGAGVDSIAVMPNGDLRACPIAYDADWAFLGRIGETDLRELISKLRRCRITGECLACNHLKGCGGRCLYMNRERLWGQSGFKKICEVTKFTIDAIAEIQPEVEEALIRDDAIRQYLDYPKYNNSTEIVP
ncbi:MAG: TIGR04084 family radical SAM/SPASM domain-containing protein [Candidatus Verstraetearchaeota archaeon]|nr:TIGR04084 family radical SAM/SPASM domain-containing protein [Candidatus Verstraetearchaeota archaeon]